MKKYIITAVIISLIADLILFFVWKETQFDRNNLFIYLFFSIVITIIVTMLIKKIKR